MRVGPCVDAPSLSLALRCGSSGLRRVPPPARPPALTKDFLMSDLPDSLPPLDELTAGKFGTEVTTGGRQPKNGVRKHFTEADKDRVLMVFLRTGKDQKRTAEITGVQLATLRKWVNDLLADRLHELSVRYGQELEEANVADMKAMVSLYSENEREALIRLREEMPNLEARDLAKAVQHLSMARSKLVHTYMTLEGRPTQVTETRNPDDALRALVDAGVIEAEVVVEDDS